MRKTNLTAKIHETSANHSELNVRFKRAHFPAVNYVYTTVCACVYVYCIHTSNERIFDICFHTAVSELSKLEFIGTHWDSN